MKNTIFIVACRVIGQIEPMLTVVRADSQIEAEKLARVELKENEWKIVKDSFSITSLEEALADGISKLEVTDIQYKSVDLNDFVKISYSK